MEDEVSGSNPSWGSDIQGTLRMQGQYFEKGKVGLQEHNPCGVNLFVNILIS